MTAATRIVDTFGTRTFTLRPYQSAAVDTLLNYFTEHTGNPILVLPVGAGKSVVQAAFIRRVIEQWPSERFLLLSHSRELLTQNANKIEAMVPGISVGVYSAGLGRKELGYQVTVAGIQSVYRKAHKVGEISIVIIDEVHLVSKAKDTMYQIFLTDLRRFCPHAKIVGMSATPWRLDSGPLIRGDNRIFTDIAYSVSIRDLIDQGYLAPLVSAPTKTRADTSKVKTRGGEYIAGDLERAMNRSNITDPALDEVERLCVDRKSWLIFCVGVTHAQSVADVLTKRGHRCAVVVGDTSSTERDRALADFKAGRLRALVNCQVLTTGIDLPNIDAIVLLRPTCSPGLLVQMVGRGVRLHPGKSNCIAEGQRVLTDDGLVPIELVTTDMRVWDGEEFVEHLGAVCRGEQEVITYAGLIATADHYVRTQEGWAAFGQCAIEQAAVVVTGDGRKAIRSTEGRQRRGGARKAGLVARGVYWLRSAFDAGLQQLEAWNRWLSEVRQSEACAAVAGTPSKCGETTLHESQEQEVLGLRSARYSVHVRDTFGNGSLDPKESRIAQDNANRSDRQQPPLRARQSSLRHVETKPIEHAKSKMERNDALVQDASSGDSLRGQHSARHVYQRTHGGSDHQEILPTLIQTKRRVWDILNAGPRHCFTAEGLLVHNCIVLDFTSNTRTHGPVDLIEIDGDGNLHTSPLVDCEACGKETPRGRPCCHCGHERTKPCQSCKEPMSLLSKECPTCGALQGTIAREAKHDTKASTASILSNGDSTMRELVATWRFSTHKKDGKPDSMCVTYEIDKLTAYREWICFEHGGFAEQKAAMWWVRHGGRSPAPRTVAEALERQAELTMPVEIRVKREGKYWRVA